MSGTLQFTRKGLRPAVEVSLGCNLDPNTVGYLRYSSRYRCGPARSPVSDWGVQSAGDGGVGGAAGGGERDVQHGGPQHRAPLHLSIPTVRAAPHISHATGGNCVGPPAHCHRARLLQHTWKLPETKRKFRAAVKLGTFGLVVEYGCEERVTEHSVLGATMVVGTSGVLCRVKLTRASQTYLFPFQLSDEILLQPGESVSCGNVSLAHPSLVWIDIF